MNTQSLFRSRTHRLGGPALPVAGLLAALLVPGGATALQSNGPRLVNTVNLSFDDKRDLTPAIAFSPVADHGIVLFGKELDAGCGPLYHEMHGSFWQPPDGWGVPPLHHTSLQPPGRRFRFALAFDPSVDAFLTTFNCTEAAAPCADGVDSWYWASGWDPSLVRLSDDQDDDDANGALCYSGDGASALAVFGDQSGAGPTYAQRIVGRRRITATGAWGGTFEIQPADGDKPINMLRQNRSLVGHVPGAAAFIVAYQKLADIFGGPMPASADVAYRVSGVNLGFGPEVRLTNDASIYDGQPILAFQPASDIGALFFHRAVGGSDLELMASLWDPSSASFQPPLQLTGDAADQRLAAVVADTCGWHVFYLAQDTGPGTSCIFYAWFNGQTLGAPTRLTSGRYAGRPLGGLNLSETGVDAARTFDGRIFLTWVDWDGVSEDTTEVHIGRLAGGGGRPLAHYQFDDSSDPGLDSSGNGHQGEHGAAVVVAGPCGDALRFRPNNNVPEFQIPHSADLDLTGDMTGMAIVRTRGQQSTDNNPSCRQGTIMSKGGNYWFTVDTNNDRLTFQNDASGFEVKADVDLCVGRWKHVAFVRSGGGNFVEFFANGLSLGPPQQLPSLPTPNVDPVMIGNYGWGNDAGACELNGVLDEVQIFDRALSACEIATLYAEGCAFLDRPCIGSSYCAGDGSASPCPCGNAGAAGAGCANGTGLGAVASAAGSTSVLANDLALSGYELLPNQPALLFSGTNAVNIGNGLPFGDGLRCVGGSVERLGVELPDAFGDATWGPGLGTIGGWSSGDTRHFQVWYRNPVTSPCLFFFNLSQALEITFSP